ncbi:MAG: hypothetical protein EP329_12710, partial [Deltaproteobacteria bacterium]
MLPSPDQRITLPPPFDAAYPVDPRFEGAELRLVRGEEAIAEVDLATGAVTELPGRRRRLAPRSPWRPAATEKGARRPLAFTHAETGEVRELAPLTWEGRADVVDVVGDLVLWCEGYEGRLELRAIAEDRAVMSATVPGAARSELAVSGDGRVVCASGEGLLWLFCADAWDDPWRFRLPGMIDALAALDATGERLALLHHETLLVQRVATLRAEPRPTALGLGESALDHVALAAGGERLVASVDGGGIAVADLSTGAVARYEHEEHLSHLTLAPDGRACALAPLAEATQEIALPTPVVAGAPLPAPHPLPGGPTAATMAYHPDGAHIALVIGHYDLARIELRGRDGAIVATFPSEGLPLRVTTSPDGRYLAWAETSGAVSTWDLAADGGPRHVLDAATPPGRGITGAARSLFVTSEATWIVEVGGRVHRAPHGGALELDWLPWDGDPDLIRPVALSPSGRLMAWAADETATVVDTATREPLLTAPVASFGVSLFLPGDGHLVVVDHAGGGLVWRVAHPALVDPPPAPAPLAIAGETP